MYIWSCDWGTSSFRLRAVDRRTGEVLGSRATQEGVKKVFGLWKEAVPPAPREAFYLRHLRREMELLQQTMSKDLSQAPVVISGMAGSSIGIRELPYARLPFSLNGEDAVVELLSYPQIPGGVYLISGVCTPEDVMRGEETQMIGLFGNEAPLQAICIQPGTHSKHIYLEGGRITGFKTYMTGELFELLSRHSILANSVTSPADLSPTLEQAFRKGVQAACDSPYSHNLFTVRTNDLFEKMTPQENFCYLSGLHVGSELSAIGSQTGQYPLVLCGGRKLSRLYQLAADQLGYGAQLRVIADDTVEAAASAGHLKIIAKKLR